MQVPLRMPATRAMRLPARPSRSALMAGMPPATAASNASGTSDSAEHRAVHREQRLVRRHHRTFPGAERRLHQRQRRPLRPADQFDDDIDVGRMRERHRIVEPVQPTDVESTVLGRIARRHRRHRDRPPGARGDDVGILAQQLENAAADGAEAGNSRS